MRLPMYDLRRTMYDLEGSRACARIFRRPLVVMNCDAYKHGYQSIREFGLLIDFPQMRLPCRGDWVRVDGVGGISHVDMEKVPSILRPNRTNFPLILGSKTTGVPSVLGENEVKLLWIWEWILIISVFLMQSFLCVKDGVKPPIRIVSEVIDWASFFDFVTE